MWKRKRETGATREPRHLAIDSSVPSTIYDIYDFDENKACISTFRCTNSSLYAVCF
jgi:hypothetical protein